MNASDPVVTALVNHQKALARCTQCPRMEGTAVHGSPANGKVMSIGQAPGNREAEFGKPFAWTAGKTLFKWFQRAGIAEDNYRKHVYMAAVCRCFPGKNPKGGDRVPSRTEIDTCRTWLNAELDLLQPELIIPIGKLAIGQFIEFDKLTEVVGQSHQRQIRGFNADLIPLPHPSGLNTWIHTEPGKSLLNKAIELIAAHPAWQAIQSEKEP